MEKKISCVRITSKNKIEHNSEEFQRKLQKAKYIFTIEMARTGFNISTHCPGQEFSLGILFRKLSDSISQPLSKNYDHELHIDFSAGVLQSLARLREGGSFLIHQDIPISSLYSGLQDVYDAIERGKDQMSWVGCPRIVQKERFHQGLILNLYQNLQDIHRPIVQGILDQVKEFDQREFEAEVRKAVLPTEFDSKYWIEKIGIVWEMFRIDTMRSLTKKEKEEKKESLRRPTHTTKHPIVELGGGERKVRKYDQRILDEVKQRPMCAHCGQLFRKQDIKQIAHVDRFDCGGSNELDNLLCAHKACDSVYDESHLIHDTKGGYWLDPRYNYKPDTDQIRGITLQNIVNRWNWVKQQQLFEGISDDDEFRNRLTEYGYMYEPTELQRK